MCNAGNPLERNTRPLRKDFDQTRIGFVKGETINLRALFPAQAFKIAHNLVHCCNGGAGQLLSFENDIQFAMVSQRYAQRR